MEDSVRRCLKKIDAKVIVIGIDGKIEATRLASDARRVERTAESCFG